MNHNAKTRVAIAKDVLKQLDSGQRRIAPTRGVYLTVDDVTPFPVGVVSKAKVPTCEACALGCMFVALADRTRIAVSSADRPRGAIERVSYRKIYRALGQHFDRPTLERIDDYFESRDEHPKRTLRRIARNIIDNRGEFTLGTRA